MDAGGRAMQDAIAEDVRGNLMMKRNNMEIAASVLKNTFLVLSRNDGVRLFILSE